MTDWHVSLDGAAHLHVSDDRPKVGDRIPLNGDEAVIEDEIVGDDGEPLFLARRQRGV